MKKIFSLFCLLLLSSSVFAWTIGPMNYQGRLLDAAGIPVTGSYTFKVRIYDAASGGTLKFAEQHNSVAVDDGVYAILVSTGSTLSGTWDINLWNTPTLYLEAEVNGQTLTPRHLLAATPFAYQANLALTTNNALALGGISATQYGNTLASICKSGKGKWLELANTGAGACLGVGASFPGPTRVNWNTLTASSDFSNLDLTRADISGIDFSGGGGNPVYMTNTIFKQTTYSVAGMTAVNLTNTVWDAATATDASAFAVASNTSLAGATMKNMDMSKWNLSAIVNANNLQYFSAAYLTVCPAAVFGYVFPNTSGVWKCKLMRTAGSQYFMPGPYANFSMTSAAATTSFGEILIDVDNTAFDNTDTSGANFSGVTLTEGFLNGYLYASNMSHTTIRNVTFTNTNLNGTWTAAIFENVNIGSSVSLNNDDFSQTKLTNVHIDSYPIGLNFTNATLDNVRFTNGIDTPNFTNTILKNVLISYYLSGAGTKFIGARIYGDFYIAAISPAPSMTFQNMVFEDATLSGALTDVNFTGTINFTHVVFKNLDLCSVSMPLAGGAPHTELADVKWEGAVECPDGSDVVGSATLYSGTCNYLTRMTAPILVGSCTAGIPGGLQ